MDVSDWKQDKCKKIITKNCFNYLKDMYYAKQLIFKTLCFKKKKKLLLTELKIKCLYVLPLKNVFYGLSISSVNPAQLLNTVLVFFGSPKTINFVLKSIWQHNHFTVTNVFWI